MTICIGMLCDSSKQAIVASDRMVTAGDLTVAFEHDVPKITELTGNCLALTAGSALVHTDLFRAVKRSLHTGANPPISEIVDKVKDEYLNIRNQEIEDRFFKVRGFNVKWFIQNQRLRKCQQNSYVK
jgi:ATP-dependent protease HslVU (ClpYQ) peptidase subunit